MDAPLLHHSHSKRFVEVNAGIEDYGQVKSVREAATVFWVETVTLWKIAGPVVFQTLCNFLANSLTTIFVGHLGDIQLSAVSISLSVIGTFSFGFLLGMGSALQTLCGQAYGAGQIHMLGIYLQRSWIILFLCCLVMLPIYIFATPVLKLIGQDHEIAELAGKFTIFIIPQLFSLAISFPAQKFLESQRKVNVLAWIGLATLINHAFLLWFFISVLGWGIYGAAAAYNISRWLIAIAQLVYVFGWCRDAWKGFSWAAFQNLWEFVELSIESAVMLCLELWYFMSLSLLAGHLQNAVIAVGSLAICMNIHGLQFMIFLGINAAISVRVSNALGSKHPRAAKYSVYTAVSQSLVIGLISMALVLIFKDYFAVIFTDSKDLQVAVSQLAWLLGVTMILNSLHPVIAGVALGGGWQGLVAYINLGSYYLFGIPLGYVLGYVADFGAAGIWGGMITGTILQTLILLVILYRTNWDTEVEETSSRLRHNAAVQSDETNK